MRPTIPDPLMVRRAISFYERLESPSFCHVSVRLRGHAVRHIAPV